MGETRQEEKRREEKRRGKLKVGRYELSACNQLMHVRAFRAGGGAINVGGLCVAQASGTTYVPTCPGAEVPMYLPNT